VLTFEKAQNPFNEKLYSHFTDVYSILQLFQTVYTAPTGNIDGLVGEELLLWSNVNYIAPRSEEGQALIKHPKPWLDENFWPYLTKCVSSTLTFLQTLSGRRSFSQMHPSRHLEICAALLFSSLSTSLIIPPTSRKSPLRCPREASTLYRVRHRA
jgi:nuclear pore complex protein Nup85